MGKAWSEYTNEPLVNRTEIVNSCADFYEDLEEGRINYFHQDDGWFPKARRGYVFIYILLSAKKGNYSIAYVGQTANPMERLEQHIADTNSSPKSNWVAETIKEKRGPYMALLNLVKKTDATKFERAYIHGFTWWGSKLLNKNLNYS